MSTSFFSELALMVGDGGVAESYRSGGSLIGRHKTRVASAAGALSSSLHSIPYRPLNPSQNVDSDIVLKYGDMYISTIILCDDAKQY